ncbi:uncharacterized protein LOC125225420 [Leguminivora glycinivorella]|uniref:uncharacterized protein LOC125225420 n=1 Tax=Leguminivora glycinivorella TaxID=1035111 RepID=UPI00200D6A67|nr:uncharacterized protein LOC125225420 [Leguminivora glycinivorella]XP_047985092.1 uncharacterized protein LOC125225420 [Leguminivora glycinivorella]XP_047985093.1 uncharacterized protein LOC125225420 [Leguminivora glycinivorella]XP_047985094.1 uncharacterized protein LOC125225420 [Leguminivora glycinivorella]
MEIRDRNLKWRPPIRAREYFLILYCNKRKICCKQDSQEGIQAWNSLSPAEQKVFVDKFEKWQIENENKFTSILGRAEPFLKKKKTRNKGNIESTLNTTKHDCDVSLSESILNVSTNSLSNAQSIADSVFKQEDINVDFYMDCDDQSESMINLRYDDTPNGDSGNTEEPRQYYTASVIDEDIDEPTAPGATNETKENASFTEPMLPTVMKPKELFEIVKNSGRRPELATLAWKDLPKNEKLMYSRAVRKIKRDYLKQYEQYLESLPSPELFKLYIKFKKEII